MRPMTLRALARAVAGAAIILSMSVASVAAHSQTVDPNGNGDGFTKPISNPWAMAHCQAASPLHVAETSNGVVQFNPARPFDNCVPGTRGNRD
jgi:hypothetical protein